ncbi:MAG: DUF1295 domain-containing protein [Treponema sp.]|nr:DUF1295 domain-containing protein [Treponema sp.]
MVVIGALCFVSLFFVKAGYGKFRSPSWGVSFNNKIAWVLMEVPTLIVMFFFIIKFRHNENILWQVLVVFMFLFHYVQRTIVFPFLIKGKSVMPLSIVVMGFVFNTINAILIGTWVFVLSGQMYNREWIFSVQFIIGTIVFLIGFIINVKSDSYIRSLRKPGDTNHYFPCKGFYRYVTSANYFGELIEWTGFAIATLSLPAVLFVYWTACNLVPRSYSINKSYKEKFSDEFAKTNPKCIIPFVF